MAIQVARPSDADIAGAIRTTISQLNAELRTAAKAGLRVELDSIRAEEIGTRPFHIYTAQILRSL